MLAATAVIARISYTLKNGRFGPSDVIAGLKDSLKIKIKDNNKS